MLHIGLDANGLIEKFLRYNPKPADLTATTY